MRDDPVSEALIFSEADVYAICGYLSEHWNVDSDIVPEETEAAITAVLASERTAADPALIPPLDHATPGEDVDGRVSRDTETPAHGGLPGETV